MSPYIYTTMYLFPILFHYWTFTNDFIEIKSCTLLVSWFHERKEPSILMFYKANKVSVLSPENDVRRVTNMSYVCARNKLLYKGVKPFLKEKIITCIFNLILHFSYDVNLLISILLCGVFILFLPFPSTIYNVSMYINLYPTESPFDQKNWLVYMGIQMGDT